MSKDQLISGPNIIHPEIPSAVGSRNSINRSKRDEYKESKAIVDEEVDKILNHVTAKMPPEVLDNLEIAGNIKSKLHGYYNQGYQNMMNRYLVTVEDELAKKYRDLIDKEEYRVLNRYTPRAVSELLDKIGGADKFNTGELEKSIVNMYGHCQGHIQRGMFELEQETNSLLRQKTDVGAFVRGENSFAIAKCSFKDNSEKPRSVVDVKLAVNVLDSELISPIHHYQEPLSDIVRSTVSTHIQNLIEKEIDSLNQSLLDEGKDELTENEAIFEKFKALDNYIDPADMDTSNDAAKRYSFVNKKFFEAIEGVEAEIDSESFDTLNLRENVKRIIDNENIRNRGFNTALNSLTSILDTSRMGYQYINNYKNARKCIIREYSETDPLDLPDEKYSITLVYKDFDELEEMKKAYTQQLDEFKHEIEKTFNVIQKLYLDYKEENDVKDFEDVYSEWLGESESSSDDEEDEAPDKLWNELVFVNADDTQVEELNPSFRNLNKELKARINFVKERITTIYDFQTPEERLIIDERIQFLEEKFQEFATQINPFHVQPGLILDIDITSIKRKKTTMMLMSNVLNEFLYNISKGFMDKAFAGFSRRRSTMREDIDESFGNIADELDEEAKVAMTAS